MVKRRASRVDENQSFITKALRSMGMSVHHTHTIGNGFGDICVGFKLMNFIVEIKNGKGKLTKDEVKFFSSWKGNAIIATDILDLLQSMKAICEELCLEEHVEDLKDLIEKLEFKEVKNV